MASPLKVVHDSSVIRPLLLYPVRRRADLYDHWLLQLWRSGAVIPIANPATVSELTENFKRASGKPHAEAASRFAEQALLPYLAAAYIIPFQYASQAPRCSDANDQKFVDLAFYGSADCLLSADNALLALADLVPFPILTLNQFRAARNRQ